MIPKVAASRASKACIFPTGLKQNSYGVITNYLVPQNNLLYCGTLLFQPCSAVETPNHGKQRLRPSS